MSRADLPAMRRASAPLVRADVASDGWGILERWKLAEQRRAYSENPSNSDDGKEELASSIGLPESVAVSKSDFRMAFARGKAAVLVCLFQNEDGEIRVILTKRAQALSSHSGEVALPGGKRDSEDADDAATALREAKEEIGLDPSLVKVVTTIEPFVSKKLLRVTPVIALLTERSKFKPVPNPGEVDTVFDAPLEMFLKDKQHRSEQRKWLGYTYQLHYFDHEADNQKFLIWGLTAAILIRCASVIYRRPPDFKELHPDDVPNPAEKSPRL